MHCTKVYYANKAAANAAIKALSFNTKDNYLRAYYCEDCHGWHLTHRQQRTEPIERAHLRHWPEFKELVKKGHMNKTIGEERMGIDFGGLTDGSTIDEIETLTAKIINLCEQLKGKNGRLAANAQNKFEEAAMWARKAAKHG